MHEITSVESHGGHPPAYSVWFGTDESFNHEVHVQMYGDSIETHHPEELGATSEADEMVMEEKAITAAIMFREFVE